MFANLLRVITGQPGANYEHSFVQDVQAAERPPRNRRVERFILAGWLLIVAKSFLVIWAVEKYHLNFNADWIIVPTVLAAGLCTFVYFRRD